MSGHYFPSTHKHLCNLSPLPRLQDRGSPVVLRFNYQSAVHPHQSNYVFSIGQCVNEIALLCCDDLR